MADRSPPEPEPAPPKSSTDLARAPRRSRRLAAPGSEPKAASEPAKRTKPGEELRRTPKRATLSPPVAEALSQRRRTSARRPKFVRQAAHRYWRIGRDGSWRSPRGLQSKQRRHYGYRSEVVSIGYRGPARARGLVPSGFRPVLVHTSAEIERIDSLKEAAIIGRTVGTRRRLALEDTARRLGVRVLNPIATPETEE